MASDNKGTAQGVMQDDLVMPVIDFGTFLHGNAEARRETATDIWNAFRNSGFLYLSNHGISKETVEAVFTASARFFERPLTQKDGLAWTTPQSNRGYVAPGREKVSQLSDPGEIARLRAANPDLKESMEIGREGVPGLPNQWPDTLDAEGAAFTALMKSFFLTCKDLHVQVMRALALGMGLGDEHFFDSYTDAGDNNLRLLHYPPVLQRLFRNDPTRVRAGEHSDYGSVTFLFQDDVGGLEVRSPRGTWVRAVPIPDTVVVNAGDLLARWSNDLIKSTNHRVVQPPPQPNKSSTVDDKDAMYPARYSIAYFCNPNFDRWIEALPTTWEERKEPQDGGEGGGGGGRKGGKKYPGIYSGDYLVQRLAATY